MKFWKFIDINFLAVLMNFPIFKTQILLRFQICKKLFLTISNFFKLNFEEFSNLTFGNLKSHFQKSNTDKCSNLLFGNPQRTFQKFNFDPFSNLTFGNRKSDFQKLNIDPFSKLDIWESEILFSKIKFGWLQIYYLEDCNRIFKN